MSRNALVVPKVLITFRFFVWHAHSGSGGRDDLSLQPLEIPTPFAKLSACHTRWQKPEETFGFWH